MRTSSTSPESAPVTAIGPVRMWPPGPRRSVESRAAATIARYAGSMEPVSVPGRSSRAPQVDTAPTITSSPELTCSAGYAAGS